jgi:hypothetical protein
MRPQGMARTRPCTIASSAGADAAAPLARLQRQLDDWPEKNWRETKWFDAHEAASPVDEGGLAEIIDRFAGSYVRFVRFSKHELRHLRRHFLNQSGL